MPSRSQRHLRDVYTSDSAGESMPAATGTRSPTSATQAAAATTAVTVTLTTADGRLAQGVAVLGSTSNAAAAIVSPSVTTNNLGVAVLTVTGVATGTATISFDTASGATIGTFAATTS
mgnify:CR=1 FL=1